MKSLTLDGSLILAAEDDRVLTYLLLPFGEVGRTSIGPLTAERGTINLPKPADLALNLEHDYTRPVAQCVYLAETDAGIVASFRVIHSTAGDDLLAEAREGLRTGVSVELAIGELDGQRIVSADLTGAGAVVRPAFQSARLAASETDTDKEDTMTDTTIAPAAAAPAPPEPAAPVAASAPEPARAPAALTAARTVKREAPAPTARDVAVALAAQASLSASADQKAMLASAAVAGPEQVFAALSDVKYDGTGGLTDMRQPEWIGELWSGKAYARKVIPRFAARPLTSMKIKGWRWKTKPTMGTWEGNKSGIPSAGIAVEAYETTAKRLAGGHDHAREYRDFPSPEYWDGYFRAMTESYARLSDEGVLTDLLAAAPEVTRGDVPATIAKGLVSIVDGALAIIETGTPSTAFVATDLWREILLTPKDKTLEYLSSSLGLEDGTLDGFKIIPHANITAGEVLVTAKEAATVRELPGVPIRVEGLDMAKGGIDTALFGYYGLQIDEPKALAHVTAGSGGTP